MYLILNRVSLFVSKVILIDVLDLESGKSIRDMWFRS